MILSRLIKSDGVAEISTAKIIAVEINTASTCKNKVISKDE